MLKRNHVFYGVFLMKEPQIVIMIVIVLTIFAGCKDNSNNYYDDGKTVGGLYATEIDYVWDNNNVSKFTLPFETYERYRFAPYSGLYFSCDLTLEQMADEVISAGHRAEIIEFGGHPQIRLYAKTGGTEYMFSISAYNATKYYVRYGN